MSLELFIYLLVAIVSWGVAAIFDKLTLKYLNPVSAFYSRAFVMIIFFTFLLLTRLSKTLIDIKNETKGFIYLSLSVIITMIGVFAYLKAMSFSEASRIVPISSTYPVITFIIAVVILGESFSFTKLCGTLLVVFGVYLISR